MAPSSLNRLRWIQQQYESGKAVRVTTSFNRVTYTEKVKFELSNGSEMRVMGSPVIAGILQALEDAMLCAVVTDKGHSSSKGHSIIEFWVKEVRLSTGLPPPPMNEQHDELPPAPPPLEDTCVTSKLENIESQLQAVMAPVYWMYNDQYSNGDAKASTISAQQNLIENQSKTLHSLAQHINNAESFSNSRSQAFISQLSATLGAYDRSIRDHLKSLESRAYFDNLPKMVSAGYFGEAPDRKAMCDSSEQVPVLRMKRYCFRRQTSIDNVEPRTVKRCRTTDQCKLTNTSTQTPRCKAATKFTQTPMLGTLDVCMQTDTLLACDAQTQVTARMFHDEMDQQARVEVEAPSSEPEIDEQSIAPESSEYESEEFLPVDKQIMRTSRFWKAVAYSDDRRRKGYVNNIVKGSVTGEVRYTVKFEDGSTEDVTREQIKRMTRSDKATSSRSR